MADTHTGYGPATSPSGTVERLRLFSVVVYGLYLLAVPSLFSSLLIGAALAHSRQDEARGTVFESHFANAVDMFWVALVVGLVGVVMWPLFYLGKLVLAVLAAWLFYRTAKGLKCAAAWQPCD